MTLLLLPNHVSTFMNYFLFKGHIGIFDPEILPSEVQQLLCVSMVGIWFRLVSGFVITSADSNYHGV